MKSVKGPILILICLTSSLWLMRIAFAGNTSKLSNIFTLDTRTENFPPINGWQVLTNKGNTYNEDIVIDNHGKVWCFYFRTPGAHQPIYLKIFTKSGYVYKGEQIAGYGSGDLESFFNSIRAAANDSTGDVWVAIQGKNGGYFVIFDSTGNVKKDSTLLGTSVFSPKIARGKDGKMWFSWHTGHDGGPESQGNMASYFANGKLSKNPTNIGRHVYLFNTDLAIDDSNRVWTVFEIKQNNQFSTKYSIFNSNLSTYMDGNIIANNPLPVNPQRQLFPDAMNQRVWILEKNNQMNQQQLHLYFLNGGKISSIELVRDCSFLINEQNFLEVVQFNDQDPLNKIYESHCYAPQNGNFYSSKTLFDSTFQFVRNGIAYNRKYPGLKVYAVQSDSQLTKLKFEPVTPGVPEISVKAIAFDTTKISKTYRKQREVKVQNIGNAVLEVYNIMALNKDFSVSETTFQVLPQQYRNIKVLFVPTHTDTIVDYLLFLSNDPGNDSLKVQVSGRGYAQTNPKITVDQDSLIFDTLILGNAQIKYLYIFNDDLYEPLRIFKINCSSSQFSTPDSLGFTLSPKKGKYIAVTFKPNIVGKLTDFLTINNNDTTKSQLKIPLRGTGIRSTPQIAVKPDTLSFGEVALGHPRSLYLEIQNKGSSSLQIKNITAADTQFTANQSYFTIAPNSKYYVLITYHARRPGAVRSTMTINSSDPLLPNYLLTVSAVGRPSLPPSISISVDTLSYGLVSIGDYKTKYFWINNLGEEPLYIQSMKTSDKRFTIYQTIATIDPQTTRSVAVTFSPDVPTTINGLLTIISNDPGNDTTYIYLTGTGRNLIPPRIVLNSNLIEFGSVATIHSLTKTFAIYNQGEQLLKVTRIEFASSNPSFTFYPLSTEVPSGQYRTVYVTFSPKQIGDLTASMRINSNDPAAPTKTVNILGTGRNPNVPQINVSTNNINFDSVAISRSKSQYLWIQNTGEQQLTIQNISTIDTSYQVNINNFILNSGQHQYVLVTFRPNLVKRYDATLLIQSNDPKSPQKNVSLTGVGRLLSPPNIRLSSTHLAFGEIPLGQKYVSGLTVYNSGERDLVISDITKKKAVFSVEWRDSVISALSNRTINITFNPQALTAYQDTLKISSNDPDSPFMQVLLTGTGRKLKDQKIAVLPDSLHFGQVGIGRTYSQNIQLRNNGEVDLKVDSIIVKHTNFSIVGDKSFTLRPGLSSMISVSFNPERVDTFKTKLTLFSNDPLTPAYQVPLIGYGRALLAPNIFFNPNELNFGEVAIGRSKTINLYVTNTGEKDLSVSNVVPGSDRFTINPTSFSVPPAHGQMITVIFQPVAVGAINSKLTVVSNDPDSALAIIQLTAVGRLLKEPQLVYNPEELNFGEVLLGDSLVKQITFQNTGDLSLFLFQIATDDKHFIVIQDSLWIESGQPAVLNVNFVPNDTTSSQGSLMFRSNDPDAYVAHIPLRGKGKAHSQRIAVSPTSLDFKEVLIHSSSTRYCWVSNFGDKVLNIFNIISNHKRFSPKIKSYTLEPNQNQQIPVIFSPDSIQTYSGKLTIISDDPVIDSLAVTLSGIGRDSVAQQIVVSIDSLNFGRVALNNTKTLAISIHNGGEKYLKVQKILTSNRVFSTLRTAFQVAPKSTENLDILFTPTSAVTHKDLLTIISNDTKHDTVVVKLIGTGREPNAQRIAVSDSVLNFETVPTDRSKSLSVWIYNQGEKNLEISQIEVSNSQFSVTEHWFVIQPGKSHYIVVTFSPVRTDSVKAFLTIKNNDPNQVEKKIKLIGKGILYTGPKISLQLLTFNFGNTLVGATKRLSLWISNSSIKDTLKISKFTLAAGSFSILPSKLAIAPEDSKAVQIIFKPLTSGSHSVNVMVNSNDKYQPATNFSVYGYGMTEKSVQYALRALNWKSDGYTPVGDYFGPGPHTDSLLSDDSDRAWFIKDFYVLTEPGTAVINLCFDDEIQLYINGTLILTEKSTQPWHWNKANYNIKRYLKLGRNRVSILVWNKVNDLGGFDCELIVDGESKIKRGDQNWTDPAATWWYYGEMGLEYPTPPKDSPYNRLWFHRDYSLTGIDSIASRWVFEPSGNDTIYDSSPYGQKAILHKITWVKGVVGEAMQFSGAADSYVELQTNLNNIPLTVEMWVNCYESKSYVQDILTNKGSALYGHGLFIDHNLRLGIYYYNNDSVLTHLRLNPHTWYFVSIQYGTDIIRVYINNKLEASIPHGDEVPIGLNFCYLGGNPSHQPSGFYGAIDELVIKNMASAPTPMPNVATISSLPPDSANKNQALELDFSIAPSPFKIISGTFQYTWGGGNVYRTKNLADPDSTFNSPLRIKVPTDSITIRGLKYRISLQTNYGPVYYPGQGLNTWLEVATDHENSGITVPEKVHRMISVPYVLNNPSIDAVLMDNLGPKAPAKWRLFEWDNAAEKYIAYDDSNWQANHGFTPGKSYWLITNKPQTFDAGAGHSPANENYLINLAPGWNMVANPFPYGLNWADVEKTSSRIADPVYRETADSIGWILNVDKLEPWEGYFIWNGDNVTRSLILPPKEAPVTPLKKQKPLADKYLERYPDLSLLLSADVRCGRFIDRDNLFGAAEGAADGYDGYDLKEAPVIGDHVSLWVDHGNWEQSAGAYTVDIRKSGAEGYAWELVVDYLMSEPEKSVELKFHQIIEGPESWLWYLFDMAEDMAINLKQQPSLTMPLAGKETSKKFKLIIGTEGFVRQNSDQIPLMPLEFELFPNYPNPFNAATTISFSLPKRLPITIKIYNLLGQVVTTLADEEVRGGHHKIYWDGRNNQGEMVSTGVYIVRLETKNNVAIKKLLLIK